MNGLRERSAVIWRSLSPSTPNIGLQRPRLRQRLRRGKLSRRSRAAAEAGSFGVPLRRRSVLAAIAFLGLLAGTPRSAQASAVVDGTTLLQECQIDLEYYRNELAGKKQAAGFSGNCVIYLRGYRDAARLASWMPFCVPDRTSNVELLDAVVNALKAHDNLGKLTTAQTALVGLREALPCASRGSVKK